jgi:hypothetical protein
MFVQMHGLDIMTQFKQLYFILGTTYVGLFIYMVFGKAFLPAKRPFWKKWKDFKDKSILDIGKFLKYENACAVRIQGHLRHVLLWDAMQFFFV